MLFVIGCWIWSSCGSVLHPGGIMIADLSKAEELQISAQASLQETRFNGMIGAQAQVAHAFNNRWGAQLTVGHSLSSEQNNRDRRSMLDVAAIRMISLESDQSHSRYSLQIGYCFQHSSIFNAVSPGLNFIQDQLYVQANSHHLVMDDFVLSAGVRLAASNRKWGNNPPFAQDNANFSRVQNEIQYINFQPVFLIVTPVIQLEYPIQDFTLLATFQATQVLNQRYRLSPVTPFHFGLRWHLHH